MVQPRQFNLTSEEIDQFQRLRASLLDFREMAALLPPKERSPEHNQQFNQLRQDTLTLLKGRFTSKVPKAITGNVSTDRSISLIVILGVILALLGLGVNSIILEDVIVNSIGFCIYGGGLLLIIGAFVVLVMRNYRQRVSSMNDLRQRSDLVLYQIDHRLKMAGVEIQSTVGSGQ